jgi:hypothetical protein
MFVFVQPFHWSAWLGIFGCVVSYWILLVAIERIDEEHGMTKETKEDEETGEEIAKELSSGELAYNACVSLTGSHNIDALSNQMRIIQTGWIYLVFMLTSIYTANLATIFTAGTAYHWPINGINVASSTLNQTTGLPFTFCLNKGSANDGYFSALVEDPSSRLCVVVASFVLTSAVFARGAYQPQQVAEFLLTASHHPPTKVHP